MKALRAVIHTAALIITLSITFSISASAGTFFVSTSGSDSNPGSQAQPFRTIQHAVDAVSAGDTIIVRAGAYAGCRIGRSGSAALPCMLRAETAGAVLINSLSAANRHSSLIEIENFDSIVAYWVIDGFDLSGSPKYGVDLRNTDHATVQNCKAHGSALTGIFLAFSYHPLIQNNESYSNGEHGIYQSNSGDFPTIRGNNLHHNASAGLHMNGDRNFTPGDGIISFAVVEKNVVWENGRSGGSGINCDGVSDSIIRNNLLYNNHASGISLYAIDGAEGSSRNKVYNNTIVMPADARWCVNIPASSEGQPNPTGNKIKNNILYTSHTFRGSISIWGGSAAGFESDYNIVVNRLSRDGGDTNMTLSAWQALGYDQHSAISTPDQLFVNPSGSDYHLKSGSAALDAGTTLAEIIDDIEGTARPQSAKFDIGCYEARVSNPAPTADFTANPLVGIAPLSVQFADSSTGLPTSWLWEFGDGSTSTSANPLHVYQNNGSFSVRLTVSNSSGQDTRSKTGYITVASNPSPPVADFSGNPLTGSAPLAVQFSDQSSGGTAWFWEFGDGASSSERNPSHSYQTAGSFSIRLTVSNAAGQASRIRNAYVNVSQSPQSADYFASAITVDVGKPKSGDLDSIRASDDSYLVTKTVRLDGMFGDLITYTFETGQVSLSTLTITYESRLAATPQRQQISLLNVNTAAWELVDSRMVSDGGDATTSVVVADPSRFVSPVGRVQLRIRTDDEAADGKWKHWIDLVKITAAP